MHQNASNLKLWVEPSVPSTATRSPMQSRPQKASPTTTLTDVTLLGWLTLNTHRQLLTSSWNLL